MEKSRFDAMARLLGGAASRRTALKTLAAVVAAGGITASMVADDVAAGDQAPRPRTCRYPGYYCTKNSHCCSEDGCKLGSSYPRRERNRCTCVQNDDGHCFRTSDCCNYRSINNAYFCQIEQDGIGRCRLSNP